MAKIIKLDEYLEKHKHNILLATTEALGYEPGEEANVNKVKDIMARQMEGLTPNEQNSFELRLVHALSNNDGNEVREMFQDDEITWEDDSFNGVDVSEGYNYRCIVNDESRKNSLMDWLEENGHEYLIDTEGRFAIKCQDRKKHYMVNRQVEAILNKWEKPSFGKNVDPTQRRPAIDQIHITALNDHINEDAKDTAFRNDDHAMSLFANNMDPIEDTDKCDHCDSYECNGECLSDDNDMNEGMPASIIKAKQRYSYMTPEEFKEMMDRIFVERDINDEEAKDMHMKKMAWRHGYGKMSPFYSKKYYSATIDEGKKKKKKKSDKRREKEASDKLDDLGQAEKGAAGHALAMSQLQGENRPKLTGQDDKKKQQDKDLGRKKIDMDEKVNEGVLGGITQIPTLARIRKLAGYEDEMTEDEMTITVIPTNEQECGCDPDCSCGCQQGGPCSCQHEEHDMLSQALDMVSQSLSIAKMFDEETLAQFKKQALLTIMETKK